MSQKATGATLELAAKLIVRDSACVFSPTDTVRPIRASGTVWRVFEHLPWLYDYDNLDSAPQRRR